MFRPSRPGRWLVMAACALLLTAASNEPAEVKELEEGKPVPSFAGFALDGSLVSLKNLLQPGKGEKPRVVVINFFGSWCEPCKKGMPIFSRVVGKMQGDQVRAVVIATQDDAAKVKPYVDQMMGGMTVLPDPFSKVSKRLGVTKLPRTMVIDSRGVLRKYFVSEEGDYERELHKAIAQVMEPPALGATAPQ